MDVESLCQIVASIGGLYSSCFSPLLIPRGTFTDSLNSWLGEPGVTLESLWYLMIYWWLGVHYLAQDTFSHGSHLDGTVHHWPQQEHHYLSSKQM